MWDRIGKGPFQPRRPADAISSRSGRRSPRRPLLEVLEGRQLLTASLAPIANQTVPSLQGLTLPLDGTGTTDPQTFTVTSSNPDIAATIAQGPFWTINVTYSNPSDPASDFSGPLTFQLFQSQTPTTVQKIEQFTNDGYYSNSGNPNTGNKGIWFSRTAPGFPGTSDYIIQGGSPNSTSTAGSSGEPGTPFANENLQQLAFTGTDQLAMANAGINTNDTQFFITTPGSPNAALGYNYTIFGQMVPNPTSETSAQSTLSYLTSLNPNGTNTNVTTGSTPPATYTASLSSTNPSGVLILDATQAMSGASSTITVTATDSVDHTTTSRSFQVTVVPYNGPTNQNLIQNLNFKPFASPTTAATQTNVPVNVTLAGQGTFPATSVSQSLSYKLTSQPSDGTITNFNQTSGTFTYTPNTGFTGNDTFQYTVTSSGPNTSSPAATSNPGTVTIAVNAPNITITKTADSATINPGQNAGYTITVSNDGAAAANNVVVTDPLPSGVTWTTSTSGASITDGVLTDNIGTLANGGSTVIHVSGATTAAISGTLTNTATVTSSNNVPSSLDATATITFNTPSLSITKTANSPTIDAGDQAAFTINVSNSAAVAANNVVVTDPLPSGVTWTTTTPGATISDGVLTDNIGTLAGGGSAAIAISGTTTAANMGKMTNTATVTSSNNVPSSLDATAKITVGPPAPVNTGAVRVVGNSLIITPLPRPLDHGTNYIDVIQVPSTATSSTPVIQVYVNNRLDTTQPQVSSIDSIIAFGSKANDIITIDPTVTIPSVIDGGHGGRNRLKGGSEETREHGWFGYTILVGGSGPNQLIGRAGQVKFRPTKSTDLIYAGHPRGRTHMLNPIPPGGTYYIFNKGRLIPVPATKLASLSSTSILPLPTPTPHRHKHD